MGGDGARRVEELRRAFEGGFLQEDTYRAALAALGREAAKEVAVDERGVAAGRDVRDNTIVTGDHVVIAGQGAMVVVGEAEIPMPAVDRETALGRYLQHVIGRNRYLHLQGIRSGGRLVQIELDRIYVRLRATQQRLVEAEERWLAAEATLAPGEGQRVRGLRQGGEAHLVTETVTVTVEEALAAHMRLVVLGDPGSGKTTLLRYLTLLYARDLAEATAVVQSKLAAEPARLPILLPMRQVAGYLQKYADESVEGHVRLLEFLVRSLGEERIHVPADFFDEWLGSGRAALLLDGLDEVADPDLRRRVARVVERFTLAYPDCRYVVTSRIVGYSGAARLGEGYAVTTVRDFSLADVREFLTQWHRMLAVAQMGGSESAEGYAAAQTQQLVEAITGNERIRELAINPLMLTVIAMVHRDRVKLPDRRAELYAEAVDVLLGKWEEAKGVQEPAILPEQPFETNDKRLLLEHVALAMHEAGQKEIDAGELEALLATLFDAITGERRASESAVARFLAVIQERTGLLVARGEGVYAFSHLTFQEYLVARAVAGRDDYVAYTLGHTADPWWREVILLSAGYLSTQSKERTARLIRAIADQAQEPEPYHNLVLAAECLRDVGGSRVETELEQRIQRQLHTELETATIRERFGPFRVTVGPKMTSMLLKINHRYPLFRVFRQLLGIKGPTGIGYRSVVSRRIAAAIALVRINGQNYWTMPYGEPNWIMIPAGEFWIGKDNLVHRLHLATYLISPVPITNTQYYRFTQATGHSAPIFWDDDRPPKEQESHPVVGIDWSDAIAYCRWLSHVTNKVICLPSEAQWEKAARGDQDKRKYPWGNENAPNRCNYRDLRLLSTTPVGVFPSGASPYGCLDMAGNVYEWTRSIWGKTYEKPDFGYPYDPFDGRENLDVDETVLRVIRGGSFGSDSEYIACAHRERPKPDHRNDGLGFRVVCLVL
ncbi:MAG: hypothetical protein DCC55_29010 [Chloroflexi bacterium]|nr:MAG: hypothetical protein DCC55_29010 [Chloroflexota bacterium]